MLGRSRSVGVDDRTGANQFEGGRTCTRGARPVKRTRPHADATRGTLLTPPGPARTLASPERDRTGSDGFEALRARTRPLTRADVSRSLTSRAQRESRRVSDAQPPAQRPTISDVARAAAVSKATVSAVLNDAPGVRESTRERVRAAMERLNYRPARAVPGRSGPRGQPAVGAMIALVIKEHDNPYYAAIVDGVRSVLEAGGHSLLIVSTGGDSAAERRAVTRLHAAGVDGFIVTPVLGQDGDLSHFFELRRRNVPLVLLERVRGLPASLVDVDNVDVSRAAVEHLIGLGHTRIAHLVGPGYSMHSHERVDGVRRAFSASRLMLRDEDLVPRAHLQQRRDLAVELLAGAAPAPEGDRHPGGALRPLCAGRAEAGGHLLAGHGRPARRHPLSRRFRGAAEVSGDGA